MNMALVQADPPEALVYSGFYQPELFLPAPSGRHDVDGFTFLVMGIVGAADLLVMGLAAAA